MDFTREPIIETIITPKDGCKLVVRSSKGGSQEEYFVDALEVVSFGQALFFRSLERPKSFLVPISDYEVIEVREARMVLKNISPDRSIKIGGGREAKQAREVEKAEVSVEEEAAPTTEEKAAVAAGEGQPELRLDKKRDRRRNYRKRRNGKEEPVKEEAAAKPAMPEGVVSMPEPGGEEEVKKAAPAAAAPGFLSSLLQPPPNLISETISKYRESSTFKSAFYLTEEEQYKPHDKVEELLNEEEEIKGNKISSESIHLIPPEEASPAAIILPPAESPVEETETPRRRKPKTAEVEDITLPFYVEEFGGDIIEEPPVGKDDDS